jgi:hypothetical protein
MLKHPLLVFLSLTCLNLCIAAPAEVKRCVFSIEVIRDGGGLWPTGYTAVGDGIFLYEHADGQITAERYQRLDIQSGAPRVPEREVFADGKAFTQRVRDLFKKSAIRELDNPAFYAAELAARQAMPVPGKILVITGAATVRVYGDLEGTRFTFSYAGLGSCLEFYADYNEKLKALKALLDGIAYEYGRARIFLDQGA